MTEEISHDDGKWFDAVLVKYSWTDAYGRSREAYDEAHVPGVLRSAKVVEYQQAYPGPGAAKAILDRSRTGPSIFDLEAVSVHSTRPFMSVQIVTPNAVSSIRQLSSVSFNLTDNTMRIGTRQTIALSATPLKVVTVNSRQFS